MRITSIFQPGILNFFQFHNYKALQSSCNRCFNKHTLLRSGTSTQILESHIYFNIIYRALIKAIPIIMESTLSVLLHIFILYLYGIPGHLFSVTHILALMTADGLTKLIIRFRMYLQYNSLPA